MSTMHTHTSLSHLSNTAPVAVGAVDSLHSILDQEQVVKILARNLDLMTDSAPTTTVSTVIRLNSNEPIYDGNYMASNPDTNMASGAVVPSYSRNVNVFDSKGRSHPFTMAFLKVAPHIWSVEIYDTVASEIKSTYGLVAYGAVTFNPDGSIYGISPSLAKSDTIEWTNGTRSSHITFNLGARGTRNGLCESDTGFATLAIHQNGHPYGALSAAVIKKGMLRLSYDNAQTRDVPLWKLK